jgi:hypothetical protein
MDTSTAAVRGRGCCQANALARRWAPLGSSYHAEAEADNNGEARVLIVRSSDEISHDDR